MELSWNEEFWKDKRVLELENLYIQYPRIEKVLKKISYCHNYSKVSSEPQCLFIKGTSGVGKSTLYKQYLKDYPIRTTGIGVEIPVLSSTIPSPATIKSVSTSLLASLGDPNADKGTANAQTYRLIKLIKVCKVELIILDEFQHFIDSESNTVLLNVANWLKHLLNETKVPIVLIGMPNSETIFSQTDQQQLSRRFSSRETISPFGFSTQEQQIEFRKFLKTLDCNLPLRTLSNLADPETAYRIYYATDGLTHYIMTLIKTASYITFMNNIDCIDFNSLSLSFDMQIQNMKPHKTNPFDLQINCNELLFSSPESEQRTSLKKKHSKNKENISDILKS